MNVSSTIGEFSGEYVWLSNFYPTPVRYEGITYPSSEHAYQAAKVLDPNERKQVLRLTAAQAKRWGKMKEQQKAVQEDWIGVKLSVMHDILCAKFEDPILRRKLLETGSSVLVEGNTWHDRFWGVHGGKGFNHLGRLLMNLRAELARAEADGMAGLGSPVDPGDAGRF